MIIHDVNFHIITINSEGIEVKPTKLLVVIIHFLERREYPDQACIIIVCCKDIVRTNRVLTGRTDTVQTRG